MRTQKRRRRENKTDYKKRIGLLKGQRPRVVFRKTNRYIIAECIESSGAKDKIIIGITSKALLKHGWPEDMKGSLKSLPASYLTGFLLGKNILEKKVNSPILDIGMARSINKGRIFAFINGLIDSGVKMKCKQEALPEKDRIEGKRLKKDFSGTFAKIKKSMGGEKGNEK